MSYNIHGYMVECLRDAGYNGAIESSLELVNLAMSYPNCKFRRFYESVAKPLLIAGYHNLPTATVNRVMEAVKAKTRNGKKIVEAMTASDFPNLAADVSNKYFLPGYEYLGDTWKPFFRTRIADDFKRLHPMRMTEVPDLIAHPTVVADDAGNVNPPSTQAFYMGARGEEALAYGVVLYSQSMEYAINLLVNGELDILAEGIKGLGRAAQRTKEKHHMRFFTDLALTYQPDGVAIFNWASHANIANAGAGVLLTTAANIQTAHATMAAQTDTNGNPIWFDKYYLVVPPALFDTAQNIYTSIKGVIVQGALAGLPTVLTGLQPPIQCPTLATLSNTCWFLVADPNQILSLESATLRGLKGPNFFTAEPYWAQALLGQKVSKNLTFEHAVVDAWGNECVDYRGLCMGHA